MRKCNIPIKLWGLWDKGNKPNSWIWVQGYEGPDNWTPTLTPGTFTLNTWRVWKLLSFPRCKSHLISCFVCWSLIHHLTHIWIHRHQYSICMLYKFFFVLQNVSTINTLQVYIQNPMITITLWLNMSMDHIQYTMITLWIDTRVRALTMIWLQYNMSKNTI